MGVNDITAQDDGLGGGGGEHRLRGCVAGAIPLQLVAFPSVPKPLTLLHPQLPAHRAASFFPAEGTPVMGAL